MPIHPAFLGGTNKAQSPTADMQQSINCYPERQDVEGGVARWILYPTPGFEKFTETAKLASRGGYAILNRCWFVLGNEVTEIFPDRAVVPRGSVAADDKPAFLCSNGMGGGQVAIASGNVAYMYDLEHNTITKSRDNVRMIDFLDGYFIAFDETTDSIVLSELFDGLTWLEDEFIQRTIAPDPIIAVRVQDALRQMWILGEQSSEVWYNAGTSPTPFKPVPGGLVPYGCAALASAVPVASSMYWLGHGEHGHHRIIRAEGPQARPISTPAIESMLDDIVVVSDAVGWTYSDKGHTFYGLSFPTGNKTIVYDETFDKWHERGTWNPELNDYEAWRAAIVVRAFKDPDRLLVGDRSGQSGIIWEADGNFTRDVIGRGVRRVRRGPGLYGEGELISYRNFGLLLEAGLGLPQGQGCEPVVELRYSDDGGKTWQSAGNRSAGRLGEYHVELTWWQLGSSVFRVFEIVMADPVPWRVVQAFVNRD